MWEGCKGKPWRIFRREQLGVQGAVVLSSPPVSLVQCEVTHPIKSSSVPRSPHPDTGASMFSFPKETLPEISSMGPNQESWRNSRPRRRSLAQGGTPSSTYAISAGARSWRQNR